MRINTLIILLIFISLFHLSPRNVVAQNNFLQFCVENTEFPPFNYFSRSGDNNQLTQGYDIDLLALSLTHSEFSYRVIALPWKRCLSEVKKGNIDAVMSASLNEDRKANYLLSAPYYRLTPSYFYLKSRYLGRVEIDNVNQLSSLGQICGIKGFNYQNFGLDNDQALLEIHSLQHLPDMLLKDRCQFFLARKEAFESTLAINNMQYLLEQLDNIAIPKAQQEPFYMLISKKSPHKERLKRLFDSKVKLLADEGRLQLMIKQHVEALKSQGKTQD
ncbi:transporter substrate-binding domain-containing protein [Shewanella sp. AS1]|uniref:substrate-binding periplasmic protein n=1 Tax=Shewanella sp. AS1 TaxID=2907626 RepID=UPI001F2C8D00|nr:transporter substrate-binding domain-containing protein [Shewanella sp. AS1]MCE9680263.1 transporter substrate-binding domain-containing protein [Shewanella sp. AS1]